jgi:phosphopantothenoylcysteine synthetase/decarboxylase
MNILVTAGNTFTPIDRVRGITNIFTGKTGTGIALYAQACAHGVWLLTSHPELVCRLSPSGREPTEGWRTLPYRTFEDLALAMEERLTNQKFDAVIHTAAVSDYQAAGIYSPAPYTCFNPDGAQWQSTSTRAPALRDRASAKVKSDEPELWLRLTRTPKLVDRVRTDWGFAGIVVKFKLEVGMSDQDLLELAERSRLHSSADLMVANTLEQASSFAFLGPLQGRYERLSREELPSRLVGAIECLHQERRHG